VPVPTRSVRRRLLRFAVASAVVAATLVGCGDDGGSGAAGCDEPAQEALDPQSVQMVLPNAPEPSYETDPPTSGPHLMSPGVKGVQDEPLTRPVQIGVLETGAVLVQHDGLTAAQREQVEGLAGDMIVVAPNDSLPDGKKVVATAWTWKMTCPAVDLSALREFVAQHLTGTSQMGGG